MLKKILVIMLICLIGVTAICSANELAYFYSDSANIGYNSLAIYSQCIDGFSTTDFNSYLSHAESQWQSAGLWYGTALNVSSGTIEYYGGKESTLAILEPDIVNHWAVTVNSTYTYQRTDTYQGLNVNVYYLNKTKVYCPTQPLCTASGYKNMFTHELGHASGWIGHSSSSADVMYPTPGNSRIYVTDRDKNHLSQMY